MKVVDYNCGVFFVRLEGSRWHRITPDKMKDFVSEAQALLRDIDENPEHYYEENTDE